MRASQPTPTGVEVTFDEHEILVSKTDARGVILYADDTFIRIAGYTEEELLGKPHAIVRHPEMPRCVFKLLWDTIANGRELFAYVVNLCKSGDHYWVFAHVTPDIDPNTGAIKGYHSCRRKAPPQAIAQITQLYQALLAEERRHPSKAAAVEASTALLHSILEERGETYEEFVFDLFNSSSFSSGRSRYAA
jgi:PAS domain S-box-containing protein